MSISSMTSTKKWFLTAGIIALLGTGTFIFSRAILSGDTLPLPGIWGLIEEKIPSNHLLKRYRTIIKRRTIEQKTTFDLTFTLHPSIFSSQFNTGEYLLSGRAHTDLLTVYDISQKEGILSGIVTIHVDGIKDAPMSEVSEYEEFESPTTNSFDAIVAWEAIIQPKDIYVYLHQVDFVTTEENGLTTLRQWYLLINQYKQKRVHFARSDVDQIAFLLPDSFIELLNNNDQKIRIVPDQDNGWLYLLSGNTLTLSGGASTDDTDTLIATFPAADIKVIFEETVVPGIINVQAEQFNDYQGTFDGKAQLDHSFRSHSIDLTGELQWPGGIWGELSYLLTQKKGNLQMKDVALPKQYLERTTIYRNRMQVKNSADKSK